MRSQKERKKVGKVGKKVRKNLSGANGLRIAHDTSHMVMIGNTLFELSNDNRMFMNLSKCMLERMNEWNETNDKEWNNNISKN